MAIIFSILSIWHLRAFYLYEVLLELVGVDSQLLCIKMVGWGIYSPKPPNSQWVEFPKSTPTLGALDLQQYRSGVPLDLC